MFDARRAYPLVLIALILAIVLSEMLLVWLAIILVALLIARPQLLRLPAILLETVGRFVGTTLSNIVLSLIFFLFVTPYSVLYRVVEKKLKDYFFSDAERVSTFKKVQQVYSKEQFEKTW